MKALAAVRFLLEPAAEFAAIRITAEGLASAARDPRQKR